LQIINLYHAFKNEFGQNIDSSEKFENITVQKYKNIRKLEVRDDMIKRAQEKIHISIQHN